MKMIDNIVSVESGPCPLGKEGVRNNSRPVANLVTRASQFGENLSTAMDRKDKIGIDFRIDFAGIEIFDQFYNWLDPIYNLANPFTNLVDTFFSLVDPFYGLIDYKTKDNNPNKSNHPYWNNMINTNGVIDQLYYENGDESDIKVEISKSFNRAVGVTLYAQLQLAYGGDMPVMAMTDGFSTNTSGKVRFTGLKAGSATTYHLRIFSSASEQFGEFRPAKVTVTEGSVSPVQGLTGAKDQSEPKEQIIATQLNAYRFFDFEHVSPVHVDGEDVIEFEIIPYDEEQSGSDQVKAFSINLNAVEIFEDTVLKEKSR